MLDHPAETPRKLLWTDLYSEAELCKAALRLYTKPLFSWRKALQSSVDGKNLYDFARHGLKNLSDIHNQLSGQKFHFRPGRELRYNFNGKRRVIYLYPWEERLVDLLLFRMLSRGLQSWFSPRSYAYRFRGFGVDRCQRNVTRALRANEGPKYIVKRDIADYFASIDHDMLLEQLANVVDRNDYLYRILEGRVRFSFSDGNDTKVAAQGIPFGTAVACAFANVYLTGLDRAESGVFRRAL
jgi:RNA-directed DNA polymerase